MRKHTEGWREFVSNQPNPPTADDGPFHRVQMMVCLPARLRSSAAEPTVTPQSAKPVVPGEAPPTHWAFPRLPNPPAVRICWVKTAIDRFILAKLRRARSLRGRGQTNSHSARNLT
jgi:hypothetical protein